MKNENIVKLSEYFEIDSDLLESKGVFNRFIGIDSKLFIDPFLMNDLGIPEFENAQDKIRTRFRKIIKLLLNSSEEGDMMFEAAVNLITCPETKGVGIGYADGSDEGNSIGAVLARDIARTGKKIINLGVEDPEMFELLGLFQEGFGDDRLSDLCIHTLFHEFISYTSRVTQELGIKSVTIRKIGEEKFNLPFIEEESRHILFIPKNALRDLPTALEDENIEHVGIFNSDLKNSLNSLVGEDWKDYISKKENRRKEFFQDSQYITDLLNHYNSKTPTSYDFVKDPKGQFDWREKAFDMVANYPLELSLSANPSFDDIKVVVRKIIEKFQKNIEHNGLRELLLKGNGRHSERYSQLLFFAVADSYCSANNLDISPESKASTGPVDFKFSNGTKKIVVEVKLTSNDIQSGVLQLEEYEKGEEAQGLYLIIRVNDHESKLEKFYDFEVERVDQNEYFPEYFIIDAREKPTPSNLKLNV